MAEQAGVPVLAASSLKAALDADRDDPAARDQAPAQILGLLDQVEAFIARQVRDQDVDCSGPVSAVGLTPANVPEAAAAGDIAASAVC